MRQSCDIHDKPVTVKVGPVRVPWLVFMHASDIRPDPTNEHGFVSPVRGVGKLNEHAADYVFIYADGTEVRAPVRRRREVGAFRRPWGECSTECVAQTKPQTLDDDHSPRPPGASWGQRQTRAQMADLGAWVNWLWA